MKRCAEISSVGRNLFDLVLTTQMVRVVLNVLRMALKCRMAHHNAQHSRWLAELDEEQLLELTLCAGYATFSPGEPLLTEGETPMFVGLLLSGSVGEVRQSGELQLRRPGEFVGEEAIFSGRPRRYEAVGLDDGAVALIAASDIALLSSRAEGLSKVLLGALARVAGGCEQDSDSCRGIEGSQRGAESIDDLTAKFACAGRRAACRRCRSRFAKGCAPRPRVPPIDRSARWRPTERSAAPMGH